jgi:hypothetical protein
MVNGNNVAYNLMTFHGAADLRTLSPANVKAQILDATLQDGPVELQPSSFGLTNARTSDAVLRVEIDSKILQLAFATVCNTLFLELCPGYSNQPHVALDHIRQVHINRKGNVRMLTAGCKAFSLANVKGMGTNGLENQVFR